LQPTIDSPIGDTCESRRCNDAMQAPQGVSTAIVGKTMMAASIADTSNYVASYDDPGCYFSDKEQTTIN
jgi:hypothetical protein